MMGFDDDEGQQSINQKSPKTRKRGQIRRHNPMLRSVINTSKADAF